MSEIEPVLQEACHDCTRNHPDLKDLSAVAVDSADLKVDDILINSDETPELSESSSSTKQKESSDLNCNTSTPNSNIQNLSESPTSSDPRGLPRSSPMQLTDSLAVSANSEEFESRHTSGLTTSATTVRM